MGSPRITYNGQNIDLPFKPRNFSVDVRVPRTVNTSISGDVETLVYPRVDISMFAEFGPIGPPKQAAAIALPLLYALRNAEHWIQSGNAWSFAMDSAKVVDTTLDIAEAAGQTVLTLSSDPGLVSGQTYKLISGPYFQLVTITNISGVSTPDVTISQALNFDFPEGAIFRDEFYYPAQIRNAEAPSMIQLRPLETLDATPWPVKVFDLILRLTEKVV